MAPPVPCARPGFPALPWERPRRSFGNSGGRGVFEQVSRARTAVTALLEPCQGHPGLPGCRALPAKGLWEPGLIQNPSDPSVPSLLGVSHPLSHQAGTREGTLL